MSKTIIFDEPFESKLKELKIKTRFINNIKNHCKRTDYDFQKKLNELNRQPNWYCFIGSGFLFINTPEGATYWYNIQYDL